MNTEAVIGKPAPELQVETWVQGDPVNIGTLAGRVVSATTAEPVKLAVIRCGGRVVQVGERGSFRLDDVPIPDGRPPLIDVSAPGHVGLTFRPDPEGTWEDLYLRMRPR